MVMISLSSQMCAKQQTAQLLLSDISHITNTAGASKRSFNLSKRSKDLSKSFVPTDCFVPLLLLMLSPLTRPIVEVPHLMFAHVCC